MVKIKKKIIKRLEKICSCCAAKIKVIFYEDKTYRGGHYFGKINLGKTVKPEYWECSKCYRGKGEKRREEKTRIVNFRKSKVLE